MHGGANNPAYWLPFTANRAFWQAPRMVVGAEGHHSLTQDGRRVLDAFSGLWCVNLGHCHPKIIEAMRAQAGQLDYAPAFNFAHPNALALADVLAGQFPGDLSHVFFVNSGSEACDSAL